MNQRDPQRFASLGIPTGVLLLASGIAFFVGSKRSETAPPHPHLSSEPLLNQTTPASQQPALLEEAPPPSESTAAAPASPANISIPSAPQEIPTEQQSSFDLNRDGIQVSPRPNRARTLPQHTPTTSPTARVTTSRGSIRDQPASEAVQAVNPIEGQPRYSTPVEAK